MAQSSPEGIILGKGNELISFNLSINNKKVVSIKKEEITLKEIEEQIISTEQIGEKVVKYLELYKGQNIYNDIALAIEFGYQLRLEENE